MNHMPAHEVVYYVIALALFMQVSYREVLRCLLEGLTAFHEALLKEILAARVVSSRGLRHPHRVRRKPQHLCADAGYKGAPAQKAARLPGHQPHIKQRREEAQAKRTRPGYRSRRWVVERTHSWLNRYRKLLVSFEKTEEGYVALLMLAAAVICWRQTISIYG